MPLPNCPTCRREINRHQSRHFHQGRVICEDCYRQAMRSAPRMRGHFATSTADDSKFRSLVGSRVGSAWPEQAEAVESPLTLACEGCQSQFATDELCWTATGRYCTACASLMEEVSAFRTIAATRRAMGGPSTQSRPIYYHPVFLAAVAVGLVVSSSIFSWKMCKTLNPPADETQIGAGGLAPQKPDSPKAALQREADANAFVASHEFGGNARPAVVNPSTEPADAEEFHWTRVDPPQSTATAPATEPTAAAAPDATANPQPATAPAPDAAATDAAPAVAPTQPDAGATAAPAQTDGAAATAAPAKPPTLNDMRREAWQMIVDGSWASAHIRFNRLIDDLPNDRGCEIGMVMADYESGDPPSVKHAVRALERFYDESPDAFITVNYARALLPTNPARSAHMLSDYLQKTQSTDEMVLNALGTALATCERDNIHAASIAQFRQVYFETEQRLEIAMNNGKKRWGADWLPAEEANTNWATLREALKSLHAAQRRTVLSKTDYRESDWQRKEADHAGSDSTASTAQTFDALLQEQISDFNNVPKPKWPDEIPLRFPDPVPEAK